MPVITLEVKRQNCINPAKAYKCATNPRKWCFQINGLNGGERAALEQALTPMKWIELKKLDVPAFAKPSLYYCPCEEIERYKESKHDPELVAKAVTFMNDKELPMELITSVLTALEFLGYTVVPTPVIHNHSSILFPMQIWTLKSTVPEA